MAELGTSSNSSLASTSSSCSTSSAQESASEDEIILVDKKNTTAKVWKHFGLKKKNDNLPSKHLSVGCFCMKIKGI